jgi:hypothetical protein
MRVSVAPIIVLTLALSGCQQEKRIEVATTTEPVSLPESPTPEPNAVLPITYLDLDLPALEPDSVFYDYLLTQRVRDLDGKRVRITGFMFSGSVYSSRNIKQFIMLRESEKDCPFGPGGQAHHAIAVTLQQPEADYTTKAVTVEGLLRIEPFAADNGNCLYVYTLTGGKIVAR